MAGFRAVEFSLHEWPVLKQKRKARKAGEATLSITVERTLDQLHVKPTAKKEEGRTPGIRKFTRVY